MDGPGAPRSAGEACFPNIGVRGRERRLRGGLVWLVIGMGATVACIRWQPPAAAFVGLYAIFFMAALGYFQAREKT